LNWWTRTCLRLSSLAIEGKGLKKNQMQISILMTFNIKVQG
jgi:hypothetical protein